MLNDKLGRKNLSLPFFHQHQTSLSPSSCLLPPVSCPK